MKITDLETGYSYETLPKEQYETIIVFEICGQEFEMDYDDVVDLSMLLLTYLESKMGDVEDANF